MLDIAFVVGPSQHYFARPDETRKVVDVPIGLVVEYTLAQPDDRADAQVTAQLLFNLLPAQGGIAIGVEQTLFGNQHGAFAVHVDGTAFVDDARPVAIPVFDLQDFAGHQLILIPREIQAAIQAAPGIEVPVDTPDL